MLPMNEMVGLLRVISPKVTREFRFRVGRTRMNEPSASLVPHEMFGTALPSSDPNNEPEEVVQIQ